MPLFFGDFGREDDEGVVLHDQPYAIVVAPSIAVDHVRYNVPLEARNVERSAVAALALVVGALACQPGRAPDAGSPVIDGDASTPLDPHARQDVAVEGAALVPSAQAPEFGDAPNGTARPRADSFFIPIPTDIEGPLPIPPGPSTSPPFDRSVAARSLGAVDVTSCKRPGGPTGAGHVSMTFAPDGSVATAQVDQPPFAGTAVGDCVAARFRGTRVPAFSGSSVKLGKSFVIN